MSLPQPMSAILDHDRQKAQPYIEQPIYGETLVQPSPLAAALAERFGEPLRPVQGVAVINTKRIKVRWLKPEIPYVSK